MRLPAPSNAAWMVRAALAYHHHSKTGRCFPSYERLAEETGLNKSSVTRAIKELVAATQIEVVKGRRAGSFNAPNSYKLLFLTHQAMLEKVRRDGRTTHMDRETPTSPLRSEVGSTKPRKRAQKRAPRRRLELTWRPSKDLMAKAASEGFSQPEIERMILDFREYYVARGEVSAVWGLDWSRWVRRQKDIKEKQDAKEATRQSAADAAGRRPDRGGDRIRRFHASITGDPGLGAGREDGGSEDPE